MDWNLVVESIDLEIVLLVLGGTITLIVAIWVGVAELSDGD